MSGYSGFYDRTEWLLMIGQRLRAEYEAVKEPVPERLAALVKQLETGSAPTDARPRNTDGSPANSPRGPGDGLHRDERRRAQPSTPTGPVLDPKSSPIGL
jgi:hypothetical protein